MNEERRKRRVQRRVQRGSDRPGSEGVGGFGGFGAFLTAREPFLTAGAPFPPRSPPSPPGSPPSPPRSPPSPPRSPPLSAQAGPLLFPPPNRLLLPVLPVVSLSAWRASSPASRSADILGVTNCPRLRVLRDALLGDGALLDLAGLTHPPTRSNQTRPRVNPRAFALWMVWPGACARSRARTVGTRRAGGRVGASRWVSRSSRCGARARSNSPFVGAQRRRRRQRPRPAIRRVPAAHRCAYPGVARAFVLELVGVAFRVAPAWVSTALVVVGGVGLPVSRVAYRCWYVASRRRGSQFWSDLERAVEEGGARGGVARDGEAAHSGSDDDDDGDDDGVSEDERDVDIARAFELVAGFRGSRTPVRRTVGVGVGRVGERASDERGLNALDRATARAAAGDRLGARDAAAEATDEIAAALEAVGIRGSIRAGDGSSSGSRRRDDSSSAGASSSRSHWPGPVAFPEWLDDETAPRHFRCPITLCVMREPATTPAGITYERAALARWLEHQRTEPSTKQRLKRSHVVPNLTLRAMIEDWLQEQGEAEAREARRRTSRNAEGGERGAGDAEDVDANASSSSRIARRPGVPPGHSAALQADRERLRAARQRMYAALKARAATNVSAEEQRWAAIRAERENGDGSGERAGERDGERDGDAAFGGAAFGGAAFGARPTGRYANLRTRLRTRLQASPNASPNTGRVTLSASPSGDSVSARIHLPRRQRRQTTGAVAKSTSRRRRPACVHRVSLVRVVVTAPRVRLTSSRSRTTARGRGDTRGDWRARRRGDRTFERRSARRAPFASCAVVCVVVCVVVFPLLLYVNIRECVRMCSCVHTPRDARWLRPPLALRPESARERSRNQSPLSSPSISLVGSRPPISPVAPFHSPTRIPQSLCVSSVMSPPGSTCRGARGHPPALPRRG